MPLWFKILILELLVTFQKAGSILHSVMFPLHGFFKDSQETKTKTT